MSEWLHWAQVFVDEMWVTFSPPSDHLIYTLCPHYHSSLVEVWVSEPVLRDIDLPQTGEKRRCPSSTNAPVLKSRLFVFKIYLPTNRGGIGHVSRGSWHTHVPNTSLSNSQTLDAALFLSEENQSVGVFVRSWEMSAAAEFDMPASPSLPPPRPSSSPSPALSAGPVPLHEWTLHSPRLELRPGERLWGPVWWNILQ